MHDSLMYSGVSNLYCSSLGNVYGMVIRKDGVVRLKKRALNKSRTGYLRTSVKTESGVKSVEVHRLVCTAFNGPAPAGNNYARHLDGNPLNNATDNLAWGSAFDNYQDSVRHGTWQVGHAKNVGSTKFFLKDVQKMRRLRDNGTRLIDLAAMFNTSKSTIWYALKHEKRRKQK